MPMPRITPENTHLFAAVVTWTENNWDKLLQAREAYHAAGAVSGT